MHIDYKKRHIETEKKFYRIMDKKRTLVLTIFIVSIGIFFLLFKVFSYENLKLIEKIFWIFFIIILFFFQTFIGQLIFKNERKKYI